MTTPTRPRPAPAPAPPRPRARCAEPDVNPDWWHPGPGEGPLAEQAAALCRRCPLVAACGSYALARPGLSGVWGALSHRARKRVRRQLQEVTTDA